MSINTIIPINKTRPNSNSQLISYATLSIQNNILNDKANIISPINLQRDTVSYFFLVTLYYIPLLGKSLYHSKKTKPKITSGTIQDASIILKTILSSIIFSPTNSIEYTKTLFTGLGGEFD